MRYLFFLLLGMLTCSPLLASTVQAGELLRHLTLGYDKLDLSTADDPKASKTHSMTAKYGFNGENGITPYLGTGLVYSIQPEMRPGDTAKINAGFAGQAGFMLQLDENASFTFDYKYLNLSSETTGVENKSRPQSIGFGLKIKF